MERDYIKEGYEWRGAQSRNQAKGLRWATGRIFGVLDRGGDIKEAIKLIRQDIENLEREAEKYARLAWKRR